MPICKNVNLDTDFIPEKKNPQNRSQCKMQNANYKTSRETSKSLGEFR